MWSSYQQDSHRGFRGQGERLSRQRRAAGWHSHPFNRASADLSDAHFGESTKPLGVSRSSADMWGQQCQFPPKITGKKTVLE